MVHDETTDLDDPMPLNQSKLRDSKSSDVSITSDTSQMYIFLIFKNEKLNYINLLDQYFHFRTIVQYQYVSHLIINYYYIKLKLYVGITFIL